MEKIRPQPPVTAKIICFISYICIFVPLLYLTVRSFYDQVEGWGTFKWYHLLLKDKELLYSLIKSFQISFTSACISTLFGIVISIMIYRSNKVYFKFIRRILDLTLIMPEIIFSLSLLVWLSLLRFPLGFYSVVITHITFTLSFVVILLLSRLNLLDSILIEAAVDLGANSKDVLFKIVLPQLKPSILTGFLLSFIISFDDFMITFFIGSTDTNTLPLVLYSRSKMGYSPTINAISSILLILSTVFSFLLFRWNRFISK